jgi:hypothetical protein
MKRQLRTLADNWKNRSHRTASELSNNKGDLALIGEIEDLAFEDMANLLYYIDGKHPLLVTVSGGRGMQRASLHFLGMINSKTTRNFVRKYDFVNICPGIFRFFPCKVYVQLS